MTTARLLTASLGILGIVQAAHAAEPAVPPDVMRLAAAEGKIQATIGADTVAQPVFVDLFAGMLVETATTIAREQGLVERLDVGSSGFRALAERHVTGPIDSALARGGASRRDALYDVMMTYSTRDAAHALLAEWLTAPAIGNLAVKAVDAASKKEEEAFLAARKAADAERGDRPLTDKERTARMLEDAVRDARRDKELLAARNQERFRRQVVPESGNGAFRVPGDAAELVYDYGNGGDANGVIDAGEWIAFTLPLENATREHWFSSSA